MSNIINENNIDYEKFLLKKFWKISLFSCFILLIIAIIFNNFAPILAWGFIFIIPYIIGARNDDFKWKFILILKNKYVKIFAIICFLPYLFVLFIKNIL